MPCFARLSIVATFWLLGVSSKCGFKNWWTMILLMCGLRVIELPIWLNGNISGEGLCLAVAPLLAQLRGLPGHLGMWQCRHFTEHRARLPKAQTKVNQQCHPFTNLWGPQKLLIEFFQELQVPSFDTVPTLPAAEWAGSMHPNLPAPVGIPFSWI